MDKLLRAFGAVEVVGSMWCGKTWLADAHGNSKISLVSRGIRDMVAADSSLAFSGETPRVIDEWQEVPSLWDEARSVIDEAGGKRGLFILTGSSTPAKGEVVHSGAGRIARVHLRPMGLLETGDAIGKVSLSGLFDDRREGHFVPFETTVSLSDIAQILCRGGWPGMLTLDAGAAALIPGQYIDTFVSSSSERDGLDEYQIRRLLISLARNMGQAVTYNTFAGDMVEGDVDAKRELVSRQRIEGLLNYLKRHFLIEDLNGWDAPIRSKSRLRTKPKRSFVDPSLGLSLLGADANRLLQDAQLFGRFFEEMCIRDLRILASTMDSAYPESLRYYKDSDGLEVDAIIELRDGRWAAIEIKLGENKVQEAANNLLRLKAKIAANPMAQNKEPSFLAILVGKTEYCRKTPEGIYVIPITYLGA
jgi:predicted AAA+ superfamily ATPase